MDETLTIRDMTKGDPPVISAAFAAQGWEKPVSLYQNYWRESVEGQRRVLIAEYKRKFAGYINIIWQSDYAPFREANIPEIADFNVIIAFRRLKIGAALMDEAERLIALQSPVAGLGVGLLSDYGAAQILYIKRGYVPDGRGIAYQARQLQYEEQVTVDHDLCLYLIKRL